jgi:hypothetical protein
MRAQRRLALSLLLLAAGLSVLATGAPAQAAPTGGLTLDPTEGRAGTTITASFQVTSIQPGADCVHTTVTFWWDRAVVGRKDGGCVVSVSFRPPKDRRDAGPHQVIARDSKTGQVGTAIFTITGTDATSTPTGRPTGTAKATAGASDPPLPTPTEGDTVTAPPSVDAARGVAPGTGGGSGPSALTSFALIVGGILVLGGVGILGFVIYRTRQMGLEPEPAGGLSDYPTQQIGLPEPSPPRHAAPYDDPEY